MINAALSTNFPRNFTSVDIISWLADRMCPCNIICAQLIDVKVDKFVWFSNNMECKVLNQVFVVFFFLKDFMFEGHRQQTF